MLTSIGIHLAIDLVKKMLGKGMHVHSRPSAPPPPPPTRQVGRGMHVGPPSFFGSWDDEKKMVRPPPVKDVPLSNIDLAKWCDYLQIPIKGIFSHIEAKPLHHHDGRLREFGHPLGLLLAGEKRHGVLRLLRDAAPTGVAKRNVSIGAQNVSLQRQPDPSG